MYRAEQAAVTFVGAGSSCNRERVFSRTSSYYLCMDQRRCYPGKANAADTCVEPDGTRDPWSLQTVAGRDSSKFPEIKNYYRVEIE
jgi:hypothetical protein